MDAKEIPVNVDIDLSKAFDKFGSQYFTFKIKILWCHWCLIGFNV